MNETILEEAGREDSWLSFLNYKLEKQHLSDKEESQIRDFIARKAYLPLCDAWRRGAYPSTLPVKRTVNKAGTRKKRVVYSFLGDEGIFLKYIAFSLYRFNDIFSKNCYSFRRGYGVRDAIHYLRKNPCIKHQYCLKIDVSNYFNSIDVDILIQKLDFLKNRDPDLYQLFVRILREKRVQENENIIEDCHGAMAGTPISPFFANVYLSEVDYFFEEMGVSYFRYSDDILLFADDKEQLQHSSDILYEKLYRLHLCVNPEKVAVSAPGEPFEFLGFRYLNGEIDLSENTIQKMKGKIKRKSEALRRWQRKKGLGGDKAAIGFIRAMNHKFYGSGYENTLNDNSAGGHSPAYDSAESEAMDEFTWNRWFFPILTVDTGLKELDAYFQQYIRYTVTGRHYKGNYRISYETLKSWGYRSLVHEYYKSKEAAK